MTDESLPTEAPIPDPTDADLQQVAPPVETEASLPELTYEQITAAVRHEVVEVDGVPEAEFARDFPLPIEARERLITAVGASLFPVATGPKGDDLTNMAANLINVGKLIDLFWEMIDAHPTNSGTGS